MWHLRELWTELGIQTSLDEIKRDVEKHAGLLEKTHTDYNEVSRQLMELQSGLSQQQVASEKTMETNGNRLQTVETAIHWKRQGRQ